MSEFSDRLREQQRQKQREALARASNEQQENIRRVTFFETMVFALLEEMRQAGVHFANGYGLGATSFYRKNLYEGTLEGGVRIPIRTGAWIRLQLEGHGDLSIMASVEINAEGNRSSGWDSLRPPGPPTPPRFDNRQRCYNRPELETWMINRIGELDLTVVARPPRGIRGVTGHNQQPPREQNAGPHDARTRAIDLRNYDAGAEPQEE